MPLWGDLCQLTVMRSMQIVALPVCLRLVVVVDGAGDRLV